MTNSKDTIPQNLGKNMIKLLQKYNLRKKILAYVKGEGFSLNTMIVALKLVIR
jgi:hypothetical protein